jgi:hypothetical protein
MPNEPVVDLTTIIGAESLFRRGQKDPWAPALAGTLADFFIYSDAGRYILPYSADPDSSSVPELLSTLVSRDNKALQPIPFPVAGLREVNPDLLESHFASFAAWARLNWKRLAGWTAVQFEDWVREGHFARVRPQYVFDVHALRESAGFQKAASELALPDDHLLHAFDVVLRYPEYGQLAGIENYYLAHPIRATQSLPTMTVDRRTAPQIPVSFRDTIAALAPHLTLDEFGSLLHEARGVVRDRGLVGQAPGSVGPEAIREIASRLKLPPRLKHSGSSLVLAGAGTSLLAIHPLLAVPAVLAGAALTIAGVFWKGGWPRGVASVSWLSWAIEWDLERQSSR